MQDIQDRGGRPAATSPHALAAAAQRLFVSRGFDNTSIADIAAEVGVSRRTFFRYFPTKADVVWVESAQELHRFETTLQTSQPGEPYQRALKRATLAALTFAPDDREWALHRAQLIFTVPAIQAHANLLQGRWRTVATEFAAARSGLTATDLFPLAVGNAVVASNLTAHAFWLAHPDTELSVALSQSLTLHLPAMPRRAG